MAVSMGSGEGLLGWTFKRSHKNPKCPAKYLLNHVKAACGCPVHIYTDPGTEKGLVAGIQGYLRADRLDEYAWPKSHRYVTAVGGKL